MKIKISVALAILLTFSFMVSAHEYWLEPETFFLRVKEKTPIHLFVGDGLVKDREEQKYRLDKTVGFQLFSSSKIWNLKDLPTAGAMPIYSFSGEKSGNYLLTMERNWSYIKLPPQEFENYLHEDGMEYIISEREKRGERDREGRERYSRFLKSLLQVGDKRDATYKKRVGLMLEITPLENPYSKKAGDTLKFQIMFDGKPLSNRVVFADNRNSETQRMTSDQDGVVTVKIDQKGLWLVRLVTMRRCQAACGEADWESFWSTYTFGV